MGMILILIAMLAAGCGNVDVDCPKGTVHISGMEHVSADQIKKILESCPKQSGGKFE